MFEVFAWLVLMTLVLMLELTGMVLAVVTWLLEGVIWLLKAAWRLVVYVAGRERRARELALRSLPQPRRVRPRGSSPLPPRGVKLPPSRAVGPNTKGG